MNTCSKCGHSTAAGETFCAECGTPLNGCRECGAPIADATSFCSECGAAVNGCRKCGQPIADGIKFCSECGTSVLAHEPQQKGQEPEPVAQSREQVVQEPVSSAQIDSLVANQGTEQPTADILDTRASSIDIHFAAVEDRTPINKRLLVIIMLLIIVMVFVAMLLVRKTRKTDIQSNTSATAPTSDASTASQTAVTPPATQATVAATSATPILQPAITLSENEGCTPNQHDVGTTSSPSFLAAIDGRKLAVSLSQCDMLVGTYTIFSRNCGYVTVLAGREKSHEEKYSFLYADEEPDGFTYKDKNFGNTSIERYLGADAVSSGLELHVKKTVDGKIKVTSEQWHLNPEDVIKGIRTPEVSVDEQTLQFCEP